MIESTNWYSYTSNNPVKYVDPTGMRQDDELSRDQIAAQQEYGEILNQEGHDPDRREKLVENAYKRNPNFGRNFKQAQKNGSEALGEFFEENFPGFEYDSSGSSLATQVDAFLQGEPVPASAGVSLTLLTLGVSLSITSDGLKKEDYYSPTTVVGASLLNLDIGSGVETSVGLSKHLSVGVKWRENYKGRTVLGGLSLSLGAGKGAPVSVSIPLHKQ